jgi:hypothetical protein
MKIHLILYSNNEPFDTTKKLCIESIQSKSTAEVVIHDYNLEKIKIKEWFSQIKDLPHTNFLGRRDGYYNSWKAFIVKEVYELMDTDDILYYTDCSQYFREGFTENIDKICYLTNKIGFIAGSIGDDVLNNTHKCCDNIDIWNIINPGINNTIYLNKNHILNSSFSMKKNNINALFLNEWVYYTVYKDNNIIYPIVTYHHTADQSIFNILVYKYKLNVFYYDNYPLSLMKDKNLILKLINNDKFINSYLVNIISGLKVDF